MMCGEDRSSLQLEWYDHVGDEEWTWLGSVILSSWVLLDTLLGTSLMLPSWFFFVVALGNLPWVSVTLASLGFDALLSVPQFEQNPIWLLTANLPPQYFGKAPDQSTS